MLVPAEPAVPAVPELGPMEPRPYRVLATRRETEDVATLLMEPVEGEPIVPVPGQFNMIWCFGVGEIPISVSRVRDDGVLVHTVRSVGAVSDAVVRLGVGDVAGVRGPFGRGWELERAVGEDVVVVAGGIGFAPLRPVVEQALASRGEYGSLVLLLGARRPEELVFLDDLARWEAWRDTLEVEVTVDAAGSDWHGHVGVVTDLVGRARFDPRRTTAFVCGPEVMMRFATRALHAAGVPLDRIKLSAERNMHCGIAHCGHCQLGDVLVCRDGPVVSAEHLLPLLGVRGR